MWFELDGRRVVSVEVAHDATIADLLDLPAGSGEVLVDGRPFDPTTRLIDLPDGAALSTPGQPLPGEPVALLTALHGADAGARWMLETGGYEFGHGFRVEVTSDRGLIVEAGGRVVAQASPGDQVDIAHTEWKLSRPDEMPEEPPTGRILFNRPPRSASEPSTPEVAVPEQPADPPRKTAPGWGVLIGPVLVGAVLAAVYRPMMLLIALAGPVLAAVSWIEDTVRNRRLRRSNSAAWAVDVDRFRTALARATQLEADRRSSLHPSLADVAQIARLRADPLWERRRQHADYLSVTIGRGSQSWWPCRTPVPVELNEEMARWEFLEAVPVELALAPGRVVGVCGPLGEARSLMRALLLRLAVHHGPADVGVAVLTDVPELWSWCLFLPHCRLSGSSSRYRLASDPSDVERVINSLEEPKRDVLVVIDGLPLEVRSRVAEMAGGELLGAAVLAGAFNDLPGRCDTVVAVHGGEAQVAWPAGSESDVMLRYDGASEDVAWDVSRDLFRIDDPEFDGRAAQLSGRVELKDLLGEIPSTQTIAAAWRTIGAGLPAPVGATADGVLAIDLVRDGPHALVAGTTGSGKSELLRSWILSLALAHGPDAIAFVLFDFKGGSAFDQCSRLPHVAGLVTDLDGDGARRALAGLHGELRYREARLRDTGCDSVDAYRSSGRSDPLPRLVVVVDEFATFADELPDFVPQLIDLARRGRSLGMHLILATQRPGGVVSDSMRANVNLRISLRVQSAGESRDVIGCDSAAVIPSTSPGRALVRIGQDRPIEFQAATLTDANDDRPQSGVSVTEVRFGWEPVPPTAAASDRPGSSVLEGAIRAMDGLVAGGSASPPRRVLAPPLPVTMEWAGPGSGRGVAIGLMDEPDRQRVSEYIWSVTEGGLVVYGLADSGTEDVLRSAAVASADCDQFHPVHIYGVDSGLGVCAGLENIPHVGGVIPAGDVDRLRRLVRTLKGTIEERRRGSGRGVVRLLLVDRLDMVLAALSGPAHLELRDDLLEILAEGPALGVIPVVSVARPGAIPTAAIAAIKRRICLRLADPFDYLMFGKTTGAVGTLGRGRGFDEAGRIVQIGTPSSEVLARVRSAVPSGGPPPAVEILPDQVGVDRVQEHVADSADGWFVPVGLGEREMAPSGFLLNRGDHLLIAGPPRSGRSTALASIAKLVGRLGVATLALTASDSPLANAVAGVVPDVDSLVTCIENSGGNDLVLFIDDAERCHDPRLAGVVEDGSARLHVVAAGRSDVLRTAYQHWTRTVRRSRMGICLRPDADLDGDLWQTRFPRHTPPMLNPGRGYLVDGGRTEVIQVAIS